jgi:hypothetical protein
VSDDLEWEAFNGEFLLSCLKTRVLSQAILLVSLRVLPGRRLIRGARENSDS